VLFKERQRPIIQHIRRRQSVLTVTQLGQGHLAIRVNEGLLIGMRVTGWLNQGKVRPTSN